MSPNFIIVNLCAQTTAQLKRFDKFNGETIQSFSQKYAHIMT